MRDSACVRIYVGHRAGIKSNGEDARLLAVGSCCNFDFGLHLLVATTQTKLSRAALVAATIICLFGCGLLIPDPSENYISYSVRPGDTLYAIATKFGVNSKQLQSINGIDDPRQIQVGQIIQVPSNGNSAESARDLKRQVELAPPPIGKVRLGEAGKYIGKMIWPTPKSRTKLTSKFGWRWLKFHDGIDLSGSVGLPIYAAHSGRVIYAGTGLSGYGKLIVIKGEGLLTIYAHNRELLVTRGELVKIGDEIAELGKSGNASGPHLHFETRVPNSSGKYVAVDPLGFYR